MKTLREVSLLCVYYILRKNNRIECLPYVLLYNLIGNWFSSRVIYSRAYIHLCYLIVYSQFSCVSPVLSTLLAISLQPLKIMLSSREVSNSNKINCVPSVRELIIVFIALLFFSVGSITRDRLIDRTNGWIRFLFHVRLLQTLNFYLHLCPCYEFNNSIISLRITFCIIHLTVVDTLKNSFV